MPTKKSVDALSFKRKWQHCSACPLTKTRDRIVLFKAKKLPAELLFIGEAPDKTEDMIGEPFVGRSGQLLKKTLKQLKLDLGKKRFPSHAITNAVCCIPLNDDLDEIRKPTRDEKLACQPRLYDFIQLCKPKLVILLGDEAKKAWRLAKLEKFGFDFTNGNPICTLELRHPAYLLRNGASENREFSENYNGCIDYKRDYLKLRDAIKLLTKKVSL